MDADGNANKEILAQRAISISNDRYVNDIISSFEQANGFTKPVNGNASSSIPKKISDPQQILAAKWKLALILKSKATIEQQNNVGDMIDDYKPPFMDKRVVWSRLRIVLSIDYEARSIFISVKAGKRATVAIENNILASQDD